MILSDVMIRFTRALLFVVFGELTRQLTFKRSLIMTYRIDNCTRGLGNHVKVSRRLTCQLTSINTSVVPGGRF
jgi:hypothetical protein